MQSAKKPLSWDKDCIKRYIFCKFLYILCKITIAKCQ